MITVRTPNSEPIPGYRLVKRLGRGGFGEVWKCEAPGGLYKAIKFVSASAEGIHSDNEGARQELRALQYVKTIRHPFLLSIERIEVSREDLIVVMELADRSLYDLLQEHRKAGREGIPRNELLRYSGEAAEVLDVLSQDHGLQHLDIKPRNLFLIGQHVKVADFGMVNQLDDPRRSTHWEPGQGGITLHYSAPETFDGKFTRFSDQYSLAITYHELLTGALPFPGTSLQELALQHLLKEPDLHRLPEADRPIVARALAKEPGERHPSCSAFLRALSGNGVVASVPAHAQPTIQDMDVEGGSDTLGPVRIAPQPARSEEEKRSQHHPRNAAVTQARQVTSMEPDVTPDLDRTGFDLDTATVPVRKRKDPDTPPKVEVPASESPASDDPDDKEEPGCASPEVSSPPLDPISEEARTQFAHWIAAVRGDWQVWSWGRVRYRFRPPQRAGIVGPLLEHLAYGPLEPTTLRRQLRPFEQQWQAEWIAPTTKLRPSAAGTSNVLATVFYQVPVQAESGKRGRGGSRLLVEIEVATSARAEEGMTDVTLRIRTADGAAAEDGVLVATVGPPLVLAVRNYLQLRPDERRHERWVHRQEVRVSPVIGKQELGDPIPAFTTDVSTDGIGLDLPHHPACEHLLVHFSSALGGSTGVPVQIQRQRSTRGGWWHVGTQVVWDLLTR
jgi:serine/threonine protein kinase